MIVLNKHSLNKQTTVIDSGNTQERKSTLPDDTGDETENARLTSRFLVWMSMSDAIDGGRRSRVKDTSGVRG